jgi:dTDP-4-dehydrorhamnose reductase
MILLLGASGYLGQAFARELDRRGVKFLPVSRQKIDYTRFDQLRELIQQTRPAFLINSAGYTGKPNVDACEAHKADTLKGNTLLPLTIAEACELENVPWGHVSSGCIYSGAWVLAGGPRRIEKDLTRPDIAKFVERDPNSIEGYSENDEPNFSFRQLPCSFYSGTKALAEEALAPFQQVYQWRLRLPFDEFDHPRNYLTKLQRYSKVYENVNSLSHRGDCVSACLDSWVKRVPFGIYNMTNPGFMTTRQVVAWVKKYLAPDKHFEYWANDDEFYKQAAITPRSNCVLNVSKLLATGVKIRPVEDAIIDSLKNWKA